MSAFRFSFVGFAARVSVGVAAALTLHSAMATDEYVVYGKRAPVIHEIDRVALRADLEQRPAAVASGAITDSMRAALREQRRAAARLNEPGFRRRSTPMFACKPRTRPRIYKPFTRRLAATC